MLLEMYYMEKITQEFIIENISKELEYQENITQDNLHRKTSREKNILYEYFLYEN